MASSNQSSNKNQHHGVGAIITTPDRSLCYVQQKDQTYPFEDFRGSYSFWGGAIEDGEERYQALERELQEEIPDFADILSAAETNEINTYKVQNDLVGEFKFTLYEIIVPKKILTSLSGTTVQEGIGVSTQRDSLASLKWILGLEHVVEDYLKRLQ